MLGIREIRDDFFFVAVSMFWFFWMEFRFEEEAAGGSVTVPSFFGTFGGCLLSVLCCLTVRLFSA